MTNETNKETQIRIYNKIIELMKSYIYLGQKMEASKNNLKVDLSRRISLARTLFGRLRDIFYLDTLNTLKARTVDQYVLPTLTYGTETWAINKEIAADCRWRREQWKEGC